MFFVRLLKSLHGSGLLVCGRFSAEPPVLYLESGSCFKSTSVLASLGPYLGCNLGIQTFNKLGKCQLSQFDLVFFYRLPEISFCFRHAESVFVPGSTHMTAGNFAQAVPTLF